MILSRTFLIIITKNGSFIQSVFFGSAGHWINVVLTFVPMISRTDDWISGSVILFMCPFRTGNKELMSKGMKTISITEQFPAYLSCPIFVKACSWIESKIWSSISVLHNFCRVVIYLHSPYGIKNGQKAWLIGVSEHLKKMF